MSLDVFLHLAQPQPAAPRAAIFVRRGGSTVEVTRAEWDAIHPGREPVMMFMKTEDSDTTQVYSANITHNLSEMAREAAIYRYLWRPEEIDVTKAAQLIKPLTDGLVLLWSDPVRFRRFNPTNGWGNYDDLVTFVDRYLAACIEHPNADVSVCI